MSHRFLCLASPGWVFFTCLSVLLVLRHVTPPGLPRWLAGFCTTGNCASSSAASSAKAVQPPGQARWRGASSLVTGLILSRAGTADEPVLQLIQKIPLKGPAGRLDHLALDAKNDRLFVANMPNNSLDVVDLKAGKLVRQIPDQKGIQGIVYAPDLDRIFVGNGEGGSCNVFDGRDYAPLKSFPLPDSDNVRYDARTQRVYVAHAEKALAVIDAKQLEVLRDIPLPGPPEAFQLELGGPRIFLNSPEAGLTAVIDREKK